MRKTLFQALAVAAAIALTQCAKADSFTFAIDGTNFQSDFTFTASQIVGQPTGVELITGVTDWFRNPDSGLVNLWNNPATVVPAYGAIYPSYATSSDGLFLYDNVLYTRASGNGILDWDGVLLKFSNGYELNIFSDAYSSNQGFFYWSDNGAYHFNEPIPTEGGAAAAPVFSSAPEPSPLIQLGSGLAFISALFYGMGRRSGREQAPA